MTMPGTHATPSQPPPDSLVLNSSKDAGRGARLRRRLIIAGVLVLALILLATWLLQSDRLARLVLAQAGNALDLEITSSGHSDVRLRGLPTLVVRDVVAREPGAHTAILRAERIFLSLPWSTIRARGKDLTVQRVELDAPILDVPALQAWLATRPPSETRIPTLTHGLRVLRGRIDNDDWQIADIDVALPRLQPQRPLDAHISGRYLDAPTAIPFDLNVALTNPGNDAGIAVIGPLTIERGDWRLPARVHLSGPLHIGDDDLRIDPARLGVAARYESGDTRLSFTLGLHGPLHFDEATWNITPVDIVMHGEGALPTLKAHGALALGRRLVLKLDGRMPVWPDAWPALPPPLGQSQAPLPFVLRYVGKPDFSEIAGLRLERDGAWFDGRFHLMDVLAWGNAAATDSPLPPLSGRLHAPQFEIAGAKLEGVQVEIDDESLPPDNKP